MSETAARRGFPATFWVANVMELFERAAYYGMNSVLAVYLTDKVAEGGLGFSEQSVGFLQSIVYAATYVIPILGGALADRYGYRRMLLVAFSLLATGYFAAGYSSSYALVFLSLLIMIVPMVVLQSVVAFVFMERHWNTVTRRLSAAVVQDISALIDVYKVYPQDRDNGFAVFADPTLAVLDWRDGVRHLPAPCATGAVLIRHHSTSRGRARTTRE